jgi:2-oxo-4-hydroxy-4-carboxy-5-ureidoimidazoline decarboxylase
MNEAVFEWLNGLEPEAAKQAFAKCCGANSWVAAMVRMRPYANATSLFAAAEQAFDGLTCDDWLIAFNSHPRIGELSSANMKLPGNKEWSAHEQAGMSSADELTIARLAEGNQLYQEKFGYPFIVFATGKGSTEMCDLLYQRLNNDPEAELQIASSEQKKITMLRLTNLLPRGAS